MTNTIAAKTHIDATITHKGETFTVYQAADHVERIMQAADDHAELALYNQRDAGLWLLQLRSIFKSNKQFGAFIADTALAKRSMQDRNDCMKIAENWDAIQKLNKNGELNRLGASAIRKRLAKANKTSAGNTSKGKPKAQAEAAPVTADSLAKATLKLLADNDISLADFRKALTKASKA